MRDCRFGNARLDWEINGLVEARKVVVGVILGGRKHFKVCDNGEHFAVSKA